MIDWKFKSVKEKFIVFLQAIFYLIPISITGIFVSYIPLVRQVIHPVVVIFLLILLFLIDIFCLVSLIDLYKINFKDDFNDR